MRPRVASVRGPKRSVERAKAGQRCPATQGQPVSAAWYLLNQDEPLGTFTYSERRAQRGAIVTAPPIARMNSRRVIRSPRRRARGLPAKWQLQWRRQFSC